MAFGACAMLVAETHGLRHVWSAVIYSLSLSGMFGVSALYHRPDWGDTGRVWMKRIDHSAIFVLIAGTGTPMCLLALPPRVGLTLLLTMWLVAICGIMKCLFWVHSPKWLSALLYIGMGWIYVYYVRELREALGFGRLWMLIVGGVIYTAGAVVYALKRPNPSPKFFGYHELFHVMVIVAATLHFYVIQSLLK